MRKPSSALNRPAPTAKSPPSFNSNGLPKHPLILVSDADVRVPPDFLANITAPLRDSKVGLGQLLLPAGESRDDRHALRGPLPSTQISGARFCNPPTSSRSDFALGAGDAHAPQIARRNRRLRRIGGIASRTIIKLGPSHRAARPSHRALPRRCGMLDAPMKLV